MYQSDFNGYSGIRNEIWKWCKFKYILRICTEYCWNWELYFYRSIDDNILTEANTLIISDIVNCNLDNLSEKETELPEEEQEEKYKSIYNPTFEEV